MAQWIWYYGDFEIYHNLQLHCRRQEYGADYPPFWSMSTPYPMAEFTKTFEAAEDSSFKLHLHGSGYVLLDGARFPENVDVPFTKGTHTVAIRVMNYGGLPSAYIDSPQLVTDGSWTATHGLCEPVPAGCIPCYPSVEDNPEIFPFAYERIDYVNKTEIDGGVLYDFGKETFAKAVLEGLDPEKTIGVFYGESREEALADEKRCCVWEYVNGQTDTELRPRAFRFIHLRGEIPADLKLYGLYEYLPLEEKGRFECDRPNVKTIWETCAYTFHLCSREFFIDGIKRDRWVWGGDARQSFMISNYIFADREIAKRTILSMLPKAYPVQHVNTINDYSMYTIISAWEYYETFGDTEFIRFIWPRLSNLYHFIDSRLSEEGLVVKRDGDWIFIDWAEMDKEGPIAAEQILLWQTEVCMDRLCRLLGMEDPSHLNKAQNLKALIMERYWSAERTAFIDSYTSGTGFISRHANIFAMLFDFVDEDTQQLIYQNVLKNDAIPPIVTPYFKLYELMALCKAGDLEYAQNMLDSYWGAMLELGATTIWEQYDPSESIPAHYGMYGAPYQKSLCHAWSSGPIYFLGRYCLGVYPTTPAYETYAIKPQAGIYKSFKGDVPTEKGNIHVEYADGVICVLSELTGGVLIAGGKEYPIEKDVLLKVEAEI